MLRHPPPEFVPHNMINNNYNNNNGIHEPRPLRPSSQNNPHHHHTIPIFSVNGAQMFPAHSGLRVNGPMMLMMQIPEPTGPAGPAAFGRPFSTSLPSGQIPPCAHNLEEAEYEDYEETYGTPVNFALCKERFNGIGDVRPFVNAIIDFKYCSEMKDESALRSFSLLLTDQAAHWWQTNKAWVTDWNSALKLLRSSYRPRMQQHRIYRRFFNAPQAEESTAAFVQRIKGLLSKIPVNTLTEETQLDLIFSMLHRRIKDKVNRDDCDTVLDLIERARKVEEALGARATAPPNTPAATKDSSSVEEPAAAKDSSSVEEPAAAKDSSSVEEPAAAKDSSSVEELAAAKDSSSAEKLVLEKVQVPLETPPLDLETAPPQEPELLQSPVSPQEAATLEPAPSEPPKESDVLATPAPPLASLPISDSAESFEPPCDHCKVYGPLFERTCRKLHKGEKSTQNIALPEEQSKLDAEKFSKIACFRCQSDNIVDLKCEKCTHEIAGGCPMISVTIHDVDFKFVVDTGSSHSVASSELLNHLIACGQEFAFNDLIMPIRGIPKRHVFRVANVEVIVAGVPISTVLVDLPSATKSVFGMDFIKQAGLTLDFSGEGTWTVRGGHGEQPVLYERLNRLQRQY